MTADFVIDSCEGDGSTGKIDVTGDTSGVLFDGDISSGTQIISGTFKIKSEENTPTDDQTNFYTVGVMFESSIGNEPAAQTTDSVNPQTTINSVFSIVSVYDNAVGIIFDKQCEIHSGDLNLDGIFSIDGQGDVASEAAS
ncbi:hypothetical protein FACS189459_7130 [Bacilli bacterium]|nr:hypothetical protein FACS189459_7130 [Bacilli bacterium]